ncbi:MAG: methyltransferase, partial [Streptosporangiaceae bacterium]
GEEERGPAQSQLLSRSLSRAGGRSPSASVHAVGTHAPGGWFRPGDNRRQEAEPISQPEAIPISQPEAIPISQPATSGGGEGSSFAGGAARWLGMLGRLRDVVRQEVLRSQLAGLPQLIGPPAQVLDVGCGQGTQALHLARAGHEVTGIDSSSELLAAFEAALAGEPGDVAARVRLIHGAGENAPALVRGAFDVVLCHGVLMYLPDISPMLGALDAVTAADGALSLLVRNGLATSMRDGLRGDWPAALAAFDSKDYVNRLGLQARAHTPAEMDAALAPLGWQRQEWYGVRVFTDHLDEPAPGPAELAGLLAAEREAGHRDPYRSVAALLHLVYRQASTAALARAPGGLAGAERPAGLIGQRHGDQARLQ